MAYTGSEPPPSATIVSNWSPIDRTGLMLPGLLGVGAYLVMRLGFDFASATWALPVGWMVGSFLMMGRAPSKPQFDFGMAMLLLGGLLLWSAPEKIRKAQEAEQQQAAPAPTAAEGAP